MLIAIFALAALGAALGMLLGVANRLLRVEGNPIVEELVAIMPGSNCGQCGFPGCTGAAEAIVDGSAAPTCCPPGGKALAAAIAAKLGLTLDLTAIRDEGPKIATWLTSLRSRRSSTPSRLARMIASAAVAAARCAPPTPSSALPSRFTT